MTRTDVGIPLSELCRQLERRKFLRRVVGVDAAAGAEAMVTGVTLDSRAVRPGDVFCAVAGARADGHEFAAAAVAAGALAVIAERHQPGLPAPQLIVERARPALAAAAAAVHGFPAHRLGVVGITGTDGKTTTSFLIRAMLESCSQPAGLVGTIEATAGGRVVGGGRATTPEAPELQAYLAQMVEAGDRFAVIESTSHGLALDKVAEAAYDVAVLTNVTHEHLEFHGSAEAYRAAKRRLFERLAVGPANPEKGWGKWAVVNLDDPVGAEFGAAATAVGAGCVTYGLSPAAVVRATEVVEVPDGLAIEVRTPTWHGRLDLHLHGRFNAHNALAAVAVGEALRLPADGVRRGLESVVRVPGRMEHIHAGQPFGVVVDYAHTANALTNALDTLRPLVGPGGGLVCVFGSAGERDTLKRPMMGRVAGERCRLVVLTDEDPRAEDRWAILDAIAAGAHEAGLRRGRDLLLVPDRQMAIRTALEQARPADVVAICGKGHEQTIETARGPLPWDDAGAVRGALAELGYSAEPGEASRPPGGRRRLPGGG